MARSEKGEKGFLSRIAGGASERVLKVVDPNQVLGHVDVDQLLDRVDVNALLDRVDVDHLLDRVDVNLLLDRVDVDQLLDRVDVDALLSRANVDAIVDRVDVRAVVERAGIPEIVAHSTGRLTGSALDLARRPLVGLDHIMFRGLNRLLGRDVTGFPEGPGDLLSWVDRHGEDEPGVMTGRYAGPLTRLLATIVDGLVITASFALMVGGVEFLIHLFRPEFEVAQRGSLFYGVMLGVWGFLYIVLGTAVVGKTAGKALLGLRVVTADGNPGLHRKEPLIRALTLPLSLILGLGLFGIVFGRERRAWHDRLAGTAVVYDWGSRTAVLPTPLVTYLERRGASVVSDDPVQLKPAPDGSEPG